MATQKLRTQSSLDRFFSITERGSTLIRELRGGLVTFVTMVYIVVLNPLIIGTVPDADGNFLGGGKAPALAAIAAVTAFVACVLTIAMGVIGRYRFALATGLGLNAFVAFQVATKMSWPAAMGMVVIEGLVITVLVLTGFRVAVFNAIPMQLKSASPSASDCSPADGGRGGVLRPLLRYRTAQDLVPRQLSGWWC